MDTPQCKKCNPGLGSFPYHSTTCQLFEGVGGVHNMDTPQDKGSESATIKLCPQCNTMKIFTKDVCRRCEVETQKDSATLVAVKDPYAGAKIDREAFIKKYGQAAERFIQEIESQALLSDRARLVDQVNRQMVPLLYDKNYLTDYRQGYEDAITKVESIIKKSR